MLKMKHKMQYMKLPGALVVQDLRHIHTIRCWQVFYFDVYVVNMRMLARFAKY